MKIYRVDKVYLKWVDMPQTQIPMRVPLLIDTDYNVLLGNCLKDRCGDKVLVIFVKKWDYLNELLPTFEKEIFDAEDPDKWLYRIDEQVCAYLRDEFTVNEQLSLFEYKNCELLSEENYKRGGAYDFKKAKRKNEIDDQLKLIQFEDDEELDRKHPEIQVDLEILKELL